MRRSLAGLALMSRHTGSGRRWLARWNNKWECFHFAGGHKEPGETFRQCVIQEIIEELDLRREDFHVENEANFLAEFTAWSRSAKCETRYVMELFQTSLGDNALCCINEDDMNRWLTDSEIRQERTVDGCRIGATTKMLLERCGVMQQ